MHTTIERLRNRLIVSCQAPANSPLNAPEVIAGIAQVCASQGVTAVRVDNPQRIRAVRKLLPDILIVGLWKKTLPNSVVRITPQLKDALAILEAGADLVAIDATARKRPDGETVVSIISGVHKNADRAVIADIDTYDNASRAVEFGADFLSTALFGYTEDTSHLTPPGYELLRDIVRDLDLPVICEGALRTPEMMSRAFELGAISVCIGTAITGIDQLAAQYVRHEPYHRTETE